MSAPAQGPEMDAWIAEHVFGATILGYAPNDPTGEGPRKPDTKPVGSREMHPGAAWAIELRCICDYREIQADEVLPQYGYKVLGHHLMCLWPVPQYSTDGNAMLELLRTMNEQDHYWSITRAPEPDAEFFIDTWEPGSIGGTAHDESATYAVCLAVHAVMTEGVEA